MTLALNIGELVAIVSAALFVGAAFESLRRLTASSISQGKRLGALEDWKAATAAVEGERRRVRTNALGVVTGEGGE